jgi:lauroyl/myristoyl acyltransferase
LALPRLLGSYLGLFVSGSSFPPLAWIGAIGSALGAVLYRFGRGRVTDINLALCFPDMPERERARWAEALSACSAATPSSSRAWCGAARADSSRWSRVVDLEILTAAQGQP